MPQAAPAPGSLFQFRKGGEVLLARALGVKSGKVLASGEDGKRLELPLDRILQAAGSVAPALPDGEARTRLREVRGEAEALVGSIDLALLWEQVRGEVEGAPIEDLVAVYFGRSGSAAERLAFGFALCADRIYFRQKGDRFVPRMESEVEAAIERCEMERRAAERRAAFLVWARARVALERAGEPPPEGTAGELAALEDLAVRGDEATHAGRARALLKDIAAGLEGNAPRFAPTADGAFDLLVRLGIFSEHENLAVRRTGIPVAFSADLLAEAAAVPAFVFEPASGRRPLPEGVPAVTIDDAETDDRDDAVSIETLPGGGFRLGIHIADVAHFVPLGSRLDEEALRRGTTVYLPRGKLSMFPPILSEERMSLEADGSYRPSLSFFATLRPDLSIAAEEIVATAIRITRNLCYEEIDAAILGTGPDPFGGAEGPGGAPPDGSGAKLLAAIGRRLLAGRIERGALDLQTPEVRVIVDALGNVTLKRIETRSPARMMVAELMILANALAARFCRDRAIPAIYRRQGGPTEPLPPREAFPSPEVHAFEVRRRLARTDLGPTPGPHFTLGLDCYLQATSPIRRYQDLVMERQIKAALGGGALPYTADDVLRLAGSAEVAAGESVAVERETTQYWLLHHLAQRRGEPEEAIALLERDGKVLVELVESQVRGFVRPRGRLEIGARTKVKIDGANPRRGEIALSPA